MATSRKTAASAGDVAAALYVRVEREVPRLARRMIDTFVAEIPLYGLLPREQLEGEILAITDANLRLFFTTLRESRPLAADELAEVRTSAARRAEERVPLDAVLSAYHVGGRIGWLGLREGGTREGREGPSAGGSAGWRSSRRRPRTRGMRWSRPASGCWPTCSRCRRRWPRRTSRSSRRSTGGSGTPAAASRPRCSAASPPTRSPPGSAHRSPRPTSSSRFDS